MKAPSTTPSPSDATQAFDVARARADFPVLATEVRGKPLSYLDNAATSQKPQAVIDRLNRYYTQENANIHRGVHYLSETATDAYESARKHVAAYLGALDPDEVIFVRGATEAINLVAHGFATTFLREGDEILLTEMEHHANIVPWQIAAERTGAKVVVVPVDDRGVLDQEAFDRLLNERTKIASFVHISNALGTVNPVREMVAKARARDVPVLLDGSQSVPHGRVDVDDLGADFFVFSGHKAFAPTGIGVLHGRRKWLREFPPYQSGGDMIVSVSFEDTVYKEIPGKFEAGTPHIAGAIALATALDYLDGLDWEGAEAHERALLEEASRRLGEIEGVRFIGAAPEKAGILSFLVGDIHPHDIGTFLDADGVAVRAGHHCTQPLMKRFGVPATARASFAFYNDSGDVDRFVQAVAKMKKFFE